MRKSNANKLLLPLALLVGLGIALPCASAPRVVNVTSTSELYAALKSYDPGDTSGIHIRLAPGVYPLKPSPLASSMGEPVCEPSVRRERWVGLHVTGERVIISGDSAGRTVFSTTPQSGVYFDDCADCALVDVSVVSDDDEGPSALVTAYNTGLEITNCVFDGYADAVVHAVGVIGNEAPFTLTNSEIRNMSGDGVLLEGVAGTTTIARTVIEGYRIGVRARPGGEATGIRAVCCADVVIEKNLIRFFDMGIMLDGSASAAARVNFAEEMRASGIAARGETNPVLDENVVFRTGACGVRIDIEEGSTARTGKSPARMWRNYIVHTGSNPEFDDGHYGVQCPLVLENVPEGFVFDDNTYYDNRRVGECAGVPKDRTREWFWRKRRSYLRKYRNTKIGVDGRHSFWDSSFLQRYSRF